MPFLLKCVIFSPQEISLSWLWLNFAFTNLGCEYVDLLEIHYVFLQIIP